MDNLVKILFTEVFVVRLHTKYLLRLNVVFMVRKVGQLLRKHGKGRSTENVWYLCTDLINVYCS